MFFLRVMFNCGILKLHLTSHVPLTPIHFLIQSHLLWNININITAYKYKTKSTRLAFMRYLRVLQVMEGLVDADAEEDNEVEAEEAVPAGILSTCGISLEFAAACPVEKILFSSSLLAV